MFEFFSDRSRRVIQLANREAQRRNHDHISPEDILLGLLSTDPQMAGGVTVEVFRLLNVNRDHVKRQLMDTMVVDTKFLITLGTPPAVSSVIEYAKEEARNLNHNYVGTEHLLLGVLRVVESSEPRSVANAVLRGAGLTLEHVRSAIRRILSDDFATIESLPANS